MIGPYGEAAWLYWEAGWRNVLPLPERAKSPPPGGYTGWAGIEPSGADIQAWIDGPEGRGNIALRLPDGIYGLDVDAYGTKQGGAALHAAEQRLGPLPATWVVSSRDDNVSGIRLFRAHLEPGRRWKDEPAGHGMGIEAIHRGHRYAVVWPSVHPETGQKYRWHWGGMHLLEWPRVDSVPELAPDWTEALSEPGEAASGEAASHMDTLASVESFRTGEPCDRVTFAASRGMSRLALARDGAALHPAGRDATHELVRLGHEGHCGARRALAEHFAVFVAARTARGEDQRKAEAEWWRLARGAVGKLSGPPNEACDCDLLRGEALLFEWSPAPAETETAVTPAGAVGAMLAELMTPKQLDDLPNPVPLIAGLLDTNTLAWLIGKSGSFKSFVALDLAAHIGHGRMWAHRQVRQGLVLYLVAEGGAGMKLRKRAWESLHGPMDEEHVKFLVRPVQAKSDEWSILVQLCHFLRPVMVVVDTQARISVGIEENSNTEMSKLVEQIDRLRRASGACVLMVHHIGRNGEDARGASSIDGAQDTELKVERTGGAKALTARIVVDKQKDGADTASIDFEMTKIDLGIDSETGRVLDSLALRVTTELFSAPSTRPWLEGLPERQTLIMEILYDQFRAEGGTRAEIMAVVRERGNRGEFKYVKSSFYAAWVALLEKGRIGRIDGTQRFGPGESE